MSLFAISSLSSGEEEEGEEEVRSKQAAPEIQGRGEEEKEAEELELQLAQLKAEEIAELKRWVWRKQQVHFVIILCLPTNKWLQ